MALALAVAATLASLSLCLCNLLCRLYSSRLAAAGSRGKGASSDAGEAEEAAAVGAEEVGEDGAFPLFLDDGAEALVGVLLGAEVAGVVVADAVAGLLRGGEGEVATEALAAPEALEEGAAVVSLTPSLEFSASVLNCFFDGLLDGEGVAFEAAAAAAVGLEEGVKGAAAEVLL